MLVYILNLRVRLISCVEILRLEGEGTSRAIPAEVSRLRFSLEQNLAFKLFLVNLLLQKSFLERSNS
jgi:hypothetical protein